MSRLSLFTLALGLAAASVSAAGIMVPTGFYKITVDAGKQRKLAYGRVTDVRLAPTDQKEPLRHWKDPMEPRPAWWYVLGTKIKSSVGRGYLAYDPSGRDPRVFLSPEAGKGTDWLIRDRKEGENHVSYGVMQAASGEVKGWFLDVEEYEEKQKEGETATAYRLILRKDVARTKVHITQISAYRPTAK